jgi:hypothetical protein
MKPDFDWEELFKFYLRAVYGQDHIVAQRAIDQLPEPLWDIAQAMYEEIDNEDG